jgi:Flp pilus assembly pilin Flp
MELLQTVFTRVRLTRFGFQPRCGLGCDQGQAIVEYCLLLALVAIIGIGVMVAITAQISTVFSSITLSL